MKKSGRAVRRRTGRQRRAGVATISSARKVLVVDVGGTSVKGGCHQLFGVLSNLPVEVRIVVRVHAAE